MVTNASTELIRVKISQRMDIVCLKMTIFEMNIGNMIAMKDLVGQHLTNLEYVTNLTKDWNGVGQSEPSLSTPLCPFLFPSYFCAERKSADDLYDFRFSYFSCHCDEFCVHFGDCCDDVGMMKSYFGDERNGNEDANGYREDVDDDKN